MNDFVRKPKHSYQDPLDRIWIACAESIGFQVFRTEKAYASTDGSGNLLIAVEAMFDPDDSLAQMIFHELCHALVEGDDGEGREDWGLGYKIGGNPWREHACLRLQAYLASGVGLRDFLAPTTDFRVSFWNSLPADPFFSPAEVGGRREKSCVAGRIAAWRASLPRWQPLHEALRATALIASVTPKKGAMDGCGRNKPTIAVEEFVEEVLPSLWTEAQPIPAVHPAGHSKIADYYSGNGCADCAWAYPVKSGLRCRHSARVGLKSNVPACQRWEPAQALDCLTCGACCREAYSSVEVSKGDAVNRKRPEYVLIQDTHRKLRREGSRCAALKGGADEFEGYACEIYADRPRTCRDFTLGSANCLDARRRVGLSL